MDFYNIQRVSIAKIKSRKVTFDMIPSHCCFDTLNSCRLFIVVHRFDYSRFIILLRTRSKVIVNSLLQDSNVFDQFNLIYRFTCQNIFQQNLFQSLLCISRDRRLGKALNPLCIKNTTSKIVTFLKNLKRSIVLFDSCKHDSRHIELILHIDLAELFASERVRVFGEIEHIKIDYTGQNITHDVYKSKLHIVLRNDLG